MSTSRFDPLWHDAVEVEYPKLQTEARLTGRHAVEFRRAAYRFAAGVLLMEKYHHNELLVMINSEGKTPTQWMDEHFELIEEMNETRERLFATIEAGVTEREYIEQTELAIFRKRKKVFDLTIKDDGRIPEPTGRAATDADRAAEFRDLYESLKAKYQTVRKQLQETRQTLGRAEVRMRKMERTIQRLKKDIESFYVVPTDKTTADS